MYKVTGASGMLGSRLVIALLKQNLPVGVFLRNSQSVNNLRHHAQLLGSDTESLLENLTITFGDITDYNAVVDFFEAGDMVFHCAAMVSFDNQHKGAIQQINTDGTANVVNAALDKHIGKLVHVSSIGALGKPGAEMVTDESHFYINGRKSDYSMSKFHSEMEVWRGIAEGLNAVIVNPSVIIGETYWNRGSGNLFSRVYNGMPFYTKGSTGFVDVTDVVLAMIQLMHSEVSGERFIISSENLTYEQFFSLVARALNVTPPRYYAKPLLTALVWRIDRLRSVLTGTKPGFTFDTHRIAHSIDRYNGHKITSTIDLTYTPIEQAIQRIAPCFLATHPVN